MKSLLVTCLIAFLAIVSGAGSYADDSNLQHIFDQRYAALKSAMTSRDSQAIVKLLGPNFVSIDTLGHSTNASQMIESIKQLPLDPNKASKTTITSIKVDGDIATVDQTYDMKTKKILSSGVSQNIQLLTTSEDKD